MCAPMCFCLCYRSAAFIRDCSPLWGLRSWADDGAGVSVCVCCVWGGVGGWGSKLKSHRPNFCLPTNVAKCLFYLDIIPLWKDAILSLQVCCQLLLVNIGSNYLLITCHLWRGNSQLENAAKIGAQPSELVANHALHLLRLLAFTTIAHPACCACSWRMRPRWGRSHLHVGWTPCCPPLSLSTSWGLSSEGPSRCCSCW